MHGQIQEGKPKSACIGSVAVVINFVCTLKRSLNWMSSKISFSSKILNGSELGGYK